MKQAPATRKNTDLTQYDPERGLKSVAVAEAAEKYFARAKDGDALYDALTAKLAAQRDFVVWWDGQEKQHGELGDRPPTQFVRLDDLGIDKETIHRRRKRLGVG